MNKGQSNIRLHKRLLQFNNLVFSYGDISSSSYTASFKGESTSYTNALHGSYYPSFGSWGKLEASEFEADVTIDFRGLGCKDDYVRYMRFIKRELGRSGKIWAVQGGSEIIWANARVLSINESSSEYETDRLQLSIQFELIDGFWVMASQTRTFLAPYAPKDFIDFDTNYCYSLQDLTGSCSGNGNQCLPCNKTEQEVAYSNDTLYQPLCHYSKDELQNMLSISCPGQYIINYDCDLESERFCYDAAWGDKQRLKKNVLNYGNSTTFTFCSRTDIPTELVRITLVGSFENPTITINDRMVKIEGNFDNQAITIGEGLEIYLASDIKNPYSNTTSLINQATFSGVPYFQFNPGINTITVTGNEYSKNSFCYVKPVDITF